MVIKMPKNKTNKDLVMVAVGKGATGKVPSYMKKFVSKDVLKENSVESSAAEEILFSIGDSNNGKI